MSEAKLLDLVAGARPNFVKLAPVYRALTAHEGLRLRIVHTGQHYDSAMSAVFFEELGLPAPDVNLEVGSGSRDEQIERTASRYADLLRNAPPAATVLFGDVNTTLGCARGAAEVGVPIVHVEAGLRSDEPAMPEERNRIETDRRSALLFATEVGAVDRLRAEGIPADRIHLVGNVMLDTAARELPAARALAHARELGLELRSYGLVTLHRAANVDDRERLRVLMDTFEHLSRELPLVFPVHPRTRTRLEALGHATEGRVGELRMVPPRTYRQTLSLLADARLVLTDSGGLQAEAAFLGVPCLVLRDVTEHRVLLATGACRAVGTDPTRIREAFADARAGQWGEVSKIPCWEGHTGPRIAEAVHAFVTGRAPAA